MSDKQPDFIQFLLSTKPKFDCYFIVGNENQGKPERIGAVKLMLMAHSEVLRLELEDSELAEKKDVRVKDVHPGTFKEMLKYTYGHDKTSTLSFDDADDMLYVAEKYMMKTLKDKLAVRLMELLNPDNICSLLNNPACYKHLELSSAMTDILRFETDHVLVSPQFLFMNTEGFLRILEQDGLVVPEIELWRAAIKWAKHRANSDDGEVLRQEMSSLAKHLKLCTLTVDEFGEVATPCVLTNNEVGAVYRSILRKEKPQGLIDLCDEIKPRNKLDVTMRPRMQRMFASSTRKQCELELTKYCNNDYSVVENEYLFNIETKREIELLPLVFGRRSGDVIHCIITVTKAGNLNNTNSRFQFETLIPRGSSRFEVPICVEKTNVILSPNNKYCFKMKINGRHQSFHCESHSCRQNEYLTVNILPDAQFQCRFPFNRLQYMVVETVMRRKLN